MSDVTYGDPDEVVEAPESLGLEADMDDTFGWDEDEATEFNRAASGALTPSTDAAQSTKGDAQYWTETLILRDIAGQAGVKMNNTEPGDRTFMIAMRFEVDPTSTHGEDKSVNIGRRVWVRLRFNKDALKRNPDKGHGWMTGQSIATWSSFIKAVGLNPKNAKQMEAFIGAHKLELIGSKALARIRQREDETGRVNDDVQRFFPVPEAEDEAF